MIEAPFEYAVPHARQAATVGAGAPLYFHIYFDILRVLQPRSHEPSVVVKSLFLHVVEPAD